MRQKLIKGPVKGYKGTDADMKCNGFQFQMSEMSVLDNDNPLELCENGFHFCQQPSGPFCYNDYERIFKVEAYDVLDSPNEPGADYKQVCRKIVFIEEVKACGDRNTGNGNTGNRNTGNRNTGDRNTGDRNTGNGNTGNGNTGDRNAGHRNIGYENTGNRNAGNWNTGDWNTGDGNTGDGNTGNRNTGDRNTGDRNTGNGNTGYRNTGDWNIGNGNAGDGNTGNGNTGNRNTGDRNTGDRNTGNRNTGDWNTGDGNTGYRNTGDGNVADFCSGYFCTKTPKVVIFDKPTNIPREKLDMDLISRLSQKLQSPQPFDLAPFLSLPNATEEKIKNLHIAYKQARKRNEKEKENEDEK